jgi:hypothetical protein
MLKKALSLSLCKIININSLEERTYHDEIGLWCCYDPEGVVLKFVKGELTPRVAIQTIATKTQTYTAASEERRRKVSS